MDSFLDPAHLFNFLALCAYILTKELILDRRDLTKQIKEIENRKDPLKALEIDFAKLSSKVINLEDAVTEQGEALNNKLDIILAEFKEKFDEYKKDLNDIRAEFTKAHREMSERITAVETELKTRRRR